MLNLNPLVKLKGFYASLLTFAVFVGGSGSAYGYNHQYINTFRSSTDNVIVSQSLEGSYGQFLLNGKAVKQADGTTAKENVTADWRGTGFRTSIGMEVMKFIQFSAGHTFVNMRSQDDGLEHMSGSKFHAETKLAFSAPIGNLELGVGGTTSKLDYQRGVEMSGFAGTGTYYSIGINYFISSKFSVFGTAKMDRSHMVRNGGSAIVSTVDTETTNIGAGFSIWM